MTPPFPFDPRLSPRQILSGKEDGEGNLDIILSCGHEVCLIGGNRSLMLIEEYPCGQCVDEYVEEHRNTTPTP